MLEREFSGKLGPLGEQYIAFAIGGATRMEQLLKDLPNIYGGLYDLAGVIGAS